MRRARHAGFTLLEVMIALAILAVGLTWILKATAQSVRNATDSRMYDTITELARSKMLDVEEQLQKDGFQETEQSTEGDFDDEGWASVTWVAKVEKAKLPSMERLQQMQAAGDQTGSGSGSGTGSDMAALNDAASGGGLMGMLSMMGGGDFSAEGAAGGSFIASQYQLIEQVFEAAIRKVSLTVKWQVVGAPRELKVVAYFTDPAAMNKVIGNATGAGAGDYGTDGEDPTQSAGSGSGSGSASGSTTVPPRRSGGGGK
jgi:general secretion pathway protein I